MQIATPISHLFEVKSDGEKIAAVSDCLECRERSVDSTWPEQKLFHFDINVNMPWDDKTQAEVAHVIHSKKELILMTLQIASCYDAPTISEGMFVPGGKRFSEEEMWDCIRTNIAWIRSFAPNKLQLGVENNNYYPTPAYDVVTDGDFLTRAVEENDLYFLLDIAHAQVSAANKKISYLSYLDTLPMHRLIQIHICQPGVKPNGLAYDAHNLPNDEMEAEVERLAQTGKVKYFTVEYYKDAENLVGSLKRLRQIIDRVAAAHG